VFEQGGVALDPIEDRWFETKKPPLIQPSLACGFR
jgi:hypothetical protein